ncbi:hypothetical protein QQP08_017901 [Theobroma cacao]|nr:hypothetical protein QQP08_017901 [Theobroma cacao]
MVKNKYKNSSRKAHCKVVILSTFKERTVSISTPDLTKEAKEEHRHDTARVAVATRVLTLRLYLCYIWDPTIFQREILQYNIKVKGIVFAIVIFCLSKKDMGSVNPLSSRSSQCLLTRSAKWQLDTSLLAKAENELETQVGIKGSASGGVGHKKPHHAICKPLSRKHCDYAQPRLSQYRKKPWRLYGSGLSCSSGHSLCPTFGKSLQDLCLSGPLMNMPSLMYHLVLVRRCVQLLLFELRVTKHWLDRLLHGLTLPLSFFAKQRITMAKTKP